MGLHSGRLIFGRIFASEIWGAYFREGLLLEGLIIGILRYVNLGNAEMKSNNEELNKLPYQTIGINLYNLF